MNRQRFLQRNFDDEGSPRAQKVALALAEVCDSDFLEALLRHKAALDEFGGQLYVAAGRIKVDRHGQPVEHSEPGDFVTYSYVLHYGHRAQIKGQELEPDVVWGTATPPPVEVEVEVEEPDDGDTDD